MFQTNVAEKMKTYFILTHFFPENSAVCEVMWENMVQLDRQQMTAQQGACPLHAG